MFTSDKNRKGRKGNARKGARSPEVYGVFETISYGSVRMQENAKNKSMYMVNGFVADVIVF